ncbi:Retrotransposon gag protein [Rhizoctonia solani]|uniref:Retrotransposon gag protein n=1 Tax=Rhizoctonia solani TaxID=456999 RepID=A0A8H7M568_9AGAM|nr:Retrotransposon gag protein [Rhizoctonia solani]
MEPEPSLTALLKAITALTSQVGSLQDQVKAQGEQISQLIAICKETNNPVGNKDQGGAQAQPGPSTGPITPPTHTGGETNTPGTVRPGLKAPFRPTRNAALVALHRDQFNEEEQMVVWILYHMTNKAADWALPIIGTIIKGKGNPPTTIPALTAKFKEAFANPDAKRAAARKIAALTQTTTMSEYVTEFHNLIAELDWNKEAYIAQFTRGLHWKVKELLSTKDNIPNKLEAIFATSIKIDNTCWENKEEQPKKTPAKSPATVATSTSTTTTRVCLSGDPNYPKGTWDQTMSQWLEGNPKETAKVAQDKLEKE